MTLRSRPAIPGTTLCHLLLGCFIAALFSYLATQVSKPHHWSDWDFGDAQSMLTLNQWQKQGWFHNHLLFKPQGYAPQVDLLDQEGLRQHAHGISPLRSSRVGPRLWYTHFPSGYLLPYALLYQLGIDSRQALQFLSISFSLTALLFMYLAFARMTTPLVALAAVVYYGTSTRFIGYADSLANQPLDDLFRFAFMLAVILAGRADRNRNRWLFTAWLLQFSLSLVSFDSVFFLYVWLIGWDVLEGRGLRWRIWLIFALAPISAHSLQLLQNVWYLGWDSALMDIADTYSSRHSISNAPWLYGHLQSIWPALRNVFSFLDQSRYGLPALFVVYAVSRSLLFRHEAGLPSGRLLLLLFLCGFAFVVVLPGAAMMDYEGRQMIPFTAMLAGGITGSFFRALRQWPQGSEPGPAAPSMNHSPWPILPLTVSGLSFVLLVTGAVFTYNRTPPVLWKNMIAFNDTGDIQFAEELKQLNTRYDPIYFVTDGALKVLDTSYMPGYPQVDPLLEHYADNRLILCFETPALLARDLLTLLDKSPDRFSPVIIAAQPKSIARILWILEKNNRLRRVPTKMLEKNGLYLLNLTRYINWRASDNLDIDTCK